MTHNYNMPDEFDFAILSFLQKDGKISFIEIAEKLPVCIGTIRIRFNKLIEEGTINIAGRLYPDKVGFRSYPHTAVFVRPAPLKETVALQIL